MKKLLLLTNSLALLTACGIITAPVSLPNSVNYNRNFNFSGPILDQNGTPLDGVLMAQQLDHHFWTPVEGGTDTDEHKLRRLDKSYTVNERGESLRLTFSRDGFYDSTYDFYNEKIIRTELGNWPQNKNFPAVMLSRTDLAHPLAGWIHDVDYANYPVQTAVELTKIHADYGGTSITILDLASIHPGTFYATLEKQIPTPINKKGDIDPQDVNLPAYLTLHISGADTGFIPIHPRLGYPPILTSDLAPEDGYQPELTISRNRLKEMRLAYSEDIIKGNEYFFFRANGHFGKGRISWTGFPADQFSFSFEIYYQPHPNDRTLIIRPR